MRVTVALTGVSGNMGRETFQFLKNSLFVGKIKVLLLNTASERRFGAKLRRRCHKVEIIYGDIGNYADCVALVSESDYVVNMAAVIPPQSDKSPVLAEKCNYKGVMNLVDAILSTENQPKFIHISTVALYGHRTYQHPWGRVGDPLLPSVYDCYAAGKLRGERYVLDSELKHWAVLRQSAMLHNKMLADNMNDGLMFHTCINVPLEWVTAEDSGRLIKNIIENDCRKEADDFWKRVYNIGGGMANRCTGYDTFDKGFGIIGGSVEQFMKPSWNSIRNFHGLWFYDGNVLDDMFHYITENVDDYWKRILLSHRYYCLAKLFPPKLISFFAIQRLLKDANSPTKWINIRDHGRVKAYFGSRDNVQCLGKDWSNYPVLAKGRIADGDIDYDALRNKENAQPYLLNHGYDEGKADNELDIEDMRQAATFRGGKCLSDNMVKGDLYTKLIWQCHDGHTFSASPYTVIKAGHWCPCCEPEPWQFDKLSKKIPFFAQIWYDTHAKEENCKYYFDKEYRAKFQIEEAV